MLTNEDTYRATYRGADKGSPLEQGTEKLTTGKRVISFSLLCCTGQRRGKRQPAGMRRNRLDRMPTPTLLSRRCTSLEYVVSELYGIGGTVFDLLRLLESSITALWHSVAKSQESELTRTQIRMDSEFLSITQASLVPFAPGAPIFIVHRI